MSSSAASSSSQPMTGESWAALTDKLVAGSAIPFSILVLPQVIQNAVNMCNGQAASLSIISWEVRSTTAWQWRSGMGGLPGGCGDADVTQIDLYMLWKPEL